MTVYFQDALTAAFPFLFWAAITSLYCAVMFAGKWFFTRGLTRRRARLHGARQ